MRKHTIYARTIRHWERDILGKLERAKGILGTGTCKAKIKYRNGKIGTVHWGGTTCPLCFKYGRPEKCTECPLRIINPGCIDTPYLKFDDKMETRNLPLAITQARAMIAFMKARFDELGLEY